jgi:hypothetical protein
MSVRKTKYNLSKNKMNRIQCTTTGCQGDIKDGACLVCGTKMVAEKKDQISTAKQQAIGDSVRAILQKETVPCTKDDLLSASESLDEMVPDDYQAWRLQADLLLAALKQLETRQIAPDESMKLLGVPLRESALRDAAEEALRNCAHFASTVEERVSLIDEANRVRNTTWF